MLTAGPFLTIRFGLVAGGGVLCAALAISNFSRTTASTVPAASAGQQQQAAPKGDGIAPALRQPVTPPPSFSLGGNQAAAPAQPPAVAVAPPKIRAQAVPGSMPAPVAIPDDFAVMPSKKRTTP